MSKSPESGTDHATSGRGVLSHLELERASRWSQVVGALTKTLSELIEPRLREVMPDVNRALRRPREGADIFDSDTMLSALNGTYLLKLRDVPDLTVPVSRRHAADLRAAVHL